MLWGICFQKKKKPKTDGKGGITKYGKNVSICQNISIPSLNICANKWLDILVTCHILFKTFYTWIIAKYVRLFAVGVEKGSQTQSWVYREVRVEIQGNN